MGIIKNILLYLWQLPQNLIGLILIIGAKKYKWFGYTFYTKKEFFNAGVTLGNYIILDEVFVRIGGKTLLDTIKHEAGHKKQSEMLGIMYLLIIGMPSFLRNIYDRIFHKKWLLTDRLNWYYKQFPENWADKLGGVERG